MSPAVANEIGVVCVTLRNGAEVILLHIVYLALPIGFLTPRFSESSELNTTYLRLRRSVAVSRACMVFTKILT